MKYNVEQFSRKKYRRGEDFNNREYRLAIARKKAARKEENYKLKY